MYIYRVSLIICCISKVVISYYPGSLECFFVLYKSFTKEFLTTYIMFNCLLTIYDSYTERAERTQSVKIDRRIL